MWKSPNANREPEAREGRSVMSVLHTRIGASSGHLLEIPDVHRAAAYSRNSKVPKYHTITATLSRSPHVGEPPVGEACALHLMHRIGYSRRKNVGKASGLASG